MELKLRPDQVLVPNKRKQFFLSMVHASTVKQTMDTAGHIKTKVQLPYEKTDIATIALRSGNKDLEVEANIHGVQLTEKEFTKSVIDDDDSVYCDNCNTSIVNFHRSCPNPDCSYDICVNCCRELKDGAPDGATESSSPLSKSLRDGSYHSVFDVVF